MSHLPHELWCHSDIINLKIANEQLQSPSPIIPIDGKSSHPETNLFQMLAALISLPLHCLLRDWAKSVALFIQTISDKNPKAPKIATSASNLRCNTIVISWLNSLKDDSMPSLAQIADGNPNADNSPQDVATPLTCSSADALDKVRKIIISMMMSYVIIRGHSQDVKEKPNPCKKQKTEKTVSKTNAQDRKHLLNIESRHNFYPFVLFILDGARTVFTATQNHQQFTISDCLEILVLFHEIHKKSKAKTSAHEVIWVNLGTHI
jgi:hypothetical protein